MLIATLAVAGVTASGCGGDDATTSAGAGEETAAEETTTETTSAPNRVDLVTPPGDELVFEPDTATAAAGLVTVVWHNESKLLHSICLEDPQGRASSRPGERFAPVRSKGPPRFRAASRRPTRT